MTEDIAGLIEALFFAQGGREPLGGVDIALLPDSEGRRAVESFLRRLNTGASDADTGASAGPGEAAGGLHTSSGEAAGGSNPVAKPTVDQFLFWGARRMDEELSALAESDGTWRAAVRRAADAVRSGELSGWGKEAARLLWPVFFPEGADLLGDAEADTENAVEELRKKRIVELTHLNPEPLTDPATELLFTSNVLLTVPHSREEIPTLPVGPELRKRIGAAFDEDQRYYYDHPIHIGTPLEKNEVIYGLRGLDDAVAYEKLHGRARADAIVNVALSLSVTHDGLHAVGRDYIESEIARSGGFDHLRVHLFTEPDCREIVEQVFVPLLQAHGVDPAQPADPARPADPAQPADPATARSPSSAVEGLLEVFGVDGEYGRHYSFLKAIAAFWHVFVDSRIRATFKIDLDQVFPQKELEEQTGFSAFGHFTSPFWGARGVDRAGTEVDLGMIAGALVNETDISHGVFTPDVPYPHRIPAGEAAVFFNKLPMAVSTRAEMGARYRAGSQCIERFHVTGGTNGILVDHLMRYRPFTPTFIGRAEDQAYLLSVLYEPAHEETESKLGRAAGNPAGPATPVLRYVHEPGLIMRHDKETFAGESIAAAQTGRFVGDLARTFYFTRYADALPWGREKAKECLDPFTGCFITTRMYTVIMLRLMLHVGGLLASSAEEEAVSVLELAAERLGPLFQADTGSDFVGEHLRRQRHAWHVYYETLRDIRMQEFAPDVLKQARTEAARIVGASRLI